MPIEHKITAGGNPVTLEGIQPSIGNQAPDFSAINTEMKPVTLKELTGGILIISGVPSLDTKVCELQTIRFNTEAATLKAKLVTISMDLPFAQKRFCDSHSIGNSVTLSDFKDREFAKNYGLYIKELGLIARSVFVINPEGKITYMEIVKEISTHPDYDRVLEEVRKIGA